MAGAMPPSPASAQHHPAKRQRQASPSEDNYDESPAATAGVAGSNGVLDSPSAATEQSDVTTTTAGGGGGGSKASGGGGGGAGGSSSSFRNVSACNRCRLRKNRCDQKLPSCASCAKAGVSCVGYDPITKREIPRRYVQLLGRHVPGRTIPGDSVVLA